MMQRMMTNAMNTRQETTAQLRKKRAKKEQNTARAATVTCLGGRECCVGVTRESLETYADHGVRRVER